MTVENTRASLLLRIRDVRDSQAWMDFVDLYMPLLHRYGLRHGLQDSDAADVAQETIRQVCRAIGHFDYDPAKGSFRGWLLTIARNELRRLLKRERRVATVLSQSPIEDTLADVPDVAADHLWEQEYQLHLFHWAAKRVEVDFRPATWHAFWQTVVDGREVAEVATLLGMSVGAVYIARSRVLARIRQEICCTEGRF